ncbi:MAG TPA: hypothetical protein DEB10_01520 [Ruminococcaceae bacterium]|jgi:tRNA G10  N-methylase Trm11|nr:hypothetical protein [Oscillospiraceae bacterium]HCA29910.1 hypothetical protein [Oscillospiraceae bacterium]
MQYKYCFNQNYEDFASGRVLYGANHVPNFPVRLINEIFQRCLAYSDKKENICLYDCCCGGGYSLTVLGFLNQSSISSIIGSDINPDMINTARKNLSLLSKKGLIKRKDEVQALYEKYRKASHIEAEQSIGRLSQFLIKEISVRVFQADALNLTDTKDRPDIIITDVPYGNLVEWQGHDGCLDRLLCSLKTISSGQTIIAISMNKSQKITQSGVKRLESQSIGKRRFEIFQFK